MGHKLTNSQLQCYLDAKWQIQSFRSRRLAIGDNLSQDILWDLKDKYGSPGQSEQRDSEMGQILDSTLIRI